MNDKTEGVPENLPSIPEADLKRHMPTTAPMAPGLAVFFNDALYTRCAKLATVMSKAEGVIGRHLIGKPEACFAVLSRAITWNLDPFAVAQCTYATPGGSIGFEGKLVQAILENSGKLEGGVNYKLEGDWSKVKSKFKIEQSQKGGKYVVPTWTREDAAGLSVIVSAKVKGEMEPRTLRVDLDSAFPLNSPLWATAPERQICYLGARAFGNIAMPGVLMGIPFDVDPTGFYGEPMTDITPPRPTKGSEFERKPKDADPRKEPETKQEPAATEKPQDSQAQPASQDTAKPETASAEPAQEAQPAKEGGGPNNAADTGRPENKTKPQAEESQPGASSEDREETPLERGQRLLKLCKTVADVGDLRQTIADELKEPELTAWGELCTRRSQAIANPQ